jgi:hypothetical protein
MLLIVTAYLPAIPEVMSRLPMCLLQNALKGILVKSYGGEQVWNTGFEALRKLLIPCNYLHTPGKERKSFPPPVCVISLSCMSDKRVLKLWKCGGSAAIALE